MGMVLCPPACGIATRTRPALPAPTTYPRPPARPCPAFACLRACAHLCLWVSVFFLFFLLVFTIATHTCARRRPPMPASFSTVSPGAGAAQPLPGLQQHCCEPLLVGQTSAPVPTTTMWCRCCCQLLYSEEPTIVGLLRCRSCERHNGRLGTAGLPLPV
ncbi:hypothetical protein BJV74DRAFT_861800 [Russula compacta]|nr:hypothetical protein BJV74DRAFT_861800 [Russula compacta]